PRMKSSFFALPCAVLVLAVSGCERPAQVPATGEGTPPAALVAEPDRPAAVHAQRIIDADREPGNWLSHGRTYSEQRYSPLQQIDRDNVRRLGVAWEFETGSMRGLEATPLVIDGVMYTTGTWSRVYAL